VASLESKLNNFIDDISKAIGSEKVSTDRPTRMCYTLTHGPECLLHENYIEEFLPAVVLRPTSTEDVQEIVKLANKYVVPLVPSGGRTGSYGAEGMRDCAIVDLRSMNRILEFDEKNYRITAEAGLLMADYVKFLRERGYMPLDWPASERSATLGSRVAVNGYNWWENGWGPAEFHVRAIKVVLPNGDAVKLARGSSRPSKCGISYNLMSLFFGSKGTLAIIRALRGIKIVKKLRALYIGDVPSHSVFNACYNFDLIKRKLGSEFIRIPLNDFIKEINDVIEDVALEKADEWAKRFLVIHDRRKNFQSMQGFT